jgi:transcriptional regulator with XRE-family HTH domain
MASRSLCLSPKGINKVIESKALKGLTQEDLASQASLSRTSIAKFLVGKRVDRRIFIEVCKVLQLDWQEVADTATSNVSAFSDSGETPAPHEVMGRVRLYTNPGGTLAPYEVVGRDRLIEKLWYILERQSLVLTAGRRMGKTSILKKMVQEPQLGMRVLFRDLEALRTPLEFVDCVYQDVRADLSRRGLAMNRVQNFIEQVGGFEMQGLRLPKQAEPHWKTILTKTMEDLTEHQEGLLIFCWDEIPMMLDNINRDQSETVAMEVLDTLRSLRQMLPSVRMVYTGSIGLHHVISRLKETGYANSPINDMFVEDVSPLLLNDACDLVKWLFIGEKVHVEDEKTLVKYVAEAVDCIPYYIHHVVNDLKWTTQPPTMERVAEIVQANLRDDSSHWSLSHYRERINTLYARAEQPLAFGILDELAATETALPIRELLARLDVYGVGKEPELVRKILMLLGRDHYIVKQPDSAYRFKFPLIKRYWQLSRGL